LTDKKPREHAVILHLSVTLRFTYLLTYYLPTGTLWRTKTFVDDQVDVYDCRIRGWWVVFLAAGFYAL